MTTLTDAEINQLDNLINRGGRHLKPEENSRLLTLWGRFRQHHDESQAALNLPCTVPPPETLFEHAKPLGPCVAVGPHVEHRDASGVRWRLLTEKEQARHTAWVEMVRLG